MLHVRQSIRYRTAVFPRYTANDRQTAANPFYPVNNHRRETAYRIVRRAGSDHLNPLALILGVYGIVAAVERHRTVDALAGCKRPQRLVFSSFAARKPGVAFAVRPARHLLAETSEDRTVTNVDLTAQQRQRGLLPLVGYRSTSAKSRNTPSRSAGHQ